MTAAIGISGSLRQGSFKTALLRAIPELAPDGFELEVASIAEIPLYDADVQEAEGFPDAVSALKERIAAADALVISTPEYNRSIPGVAKNAIDWLSRPANDIPRVFGNLPVGLIGATPGRGGTRFAQTAWLTILSALGTRPFFGDSLFLDGIRRAFDDDLRLTDPKVRELVGVYLESFATYCAEQPRG